MARSRRRSGRIQKTPEPTGATDDDSQTQPAQEGEEKGQRKQVDVCPACKDDSDQTPPSADKEQWVRCDACKIWFHWRCAGQGDLEAVDKWCVPSRPLSATKLVLDVDRVHICAPAWMKQVLQTVS